MIEILLFVFICFQIIQISRSQYYRDYLDLYKFDLCISPNDQWIKDKLGGPLRKECHHVVIRFAKDLEHGNYHNGRKFYIEKLEVHFIDSHKKVFYPTEFKVDHKVINEYYEMRLKRQGMVHVKVEFDHDDQYSLIPNHYRILPSLWSEKFRDVEGDRTGDILKLYHYFAGPKRESDSMVELLTRFYEKQVEGPINTLVGVSRTDLTETTDLGNTPWLLGRNLPWPRCKECKE